jgi:N6-adenosine-specific RNA methylase IME4
MNYSDMKKYNVIYADPPWDYTNKKVGGKSKSGACQQYKTIVGGGIDLPITEITQDNAVCFMWVTVPLLPDGLQLLSAWGFKYKTMLTWKKKGLWMGYWFRGVTEHILVGVKGSVPAFNCQKSNFFECTPGKHSQKPHYFRQLISEAVKKSFTEPVKLELFARSREGFFPDMEYEGWDVYGNEVNNSITL